MTSADIAAEAASAAARIRYPVNLDAQAGFNHGFREGAAWEREMDPTPAEVEAAKEALALGGADPALATWVLIAARRANR